MIDTREELFLSVPEEDVGKRLDAYAASVFDMSRSAAERLISDGSLTVNGNLAVKKYQVKSGDLIRALLPEPEPLEALPENIPLDIVYEDDDVVVVNKPAGMVVHPAPGNPDGTLVNALLYHCGTTLSGIGGVFRPGIVHRIDKDTSGLLVVAKNDQAHLALSEQLKTHTVSRVYTAIALGNLRDDSGVIDAPIGRDPKDRKKMAIIRDGIHTSRDAVTHWSLLDRASAFNQSFSLVRCKLETGRTHQIRVHFASIGHPLLGDPVYGGDRSVFQSHHPSLIHGQCLHAGELQFIHPATGSEMHFEAPLPPDLKKTAELIFGEDGEVL